MEKYREYRRIKKKYISAACLFIILLTAGVGLTDYTSNYLINSDKDIKIISFRVNTDYLEVSLMNAKFHIDISYLNNDLRKIRNSW